MSIHTESNFPDQVWLQIRYLKSRQRRNHLFVKLQCLRVGQAN